MGNLKQGEKSMENEATESQPFMEETSCAFTEHRPTRFSFKYDETHPGCITLTKTLAAQFKGVAPSIPFIAPNQKEKMFLLLALTI